MVVCVNKMDLIDWDQGRYEQIKSDFMEFAARLNVHDITFIPISALRGDNVVQRSEHMWWYDGSPLLNHLESVYIGSDENFIDPRFPVQYVIRSQTAENPDFRGYAGTVASGVLRPGDDVLVMPTGTTSRIAAIATADGEVAEAFPPMAVVITLADDIAVSRGDILCRPNNRPTVSHEIEATVCWMDERSSLAEGRPFLLKHSTRTVRATVQSLHYRLDINGLHRDEAAAVLDLNEVGRVTFRCTEPLLVDDYTTNRSTGSFIIIDPATNSTVGAGVIRVIATAHASPNVVRHDGRLSRVDRFAALGTTGATLLFTGLSGAGKSTLAAGVEEAFVRSGRSAFLLDGDNLRHGLNADLGFSDRDRTENVRRAGEVAAMFAEAGSLALIALICPFEEDRAAHPRPARPGGARLRRDFRRHVHRGVRAARPQGPLRPGPGRAAPRFHRHRLGLRGAGPPRPGPRLRFGVVARADLPGARPARRPAALARGPEGGRQRRRQAPASASACGWPVPIRGGWSRPICGLSSLPAQGLSIRGTFLKTINEFV